MTQTVAAHPSLAFQAAVEAMVRKASRLGESAHHGFQKQDFINELEEVGVAPDEAMLVWNSLDRSQRSVQYMDYSWMQDFRQARSNYQLAEHFGLLLDWHGARCYVLYVLAWHYLDEYVFVPKGPKRQRWLRPGRRQGPPSLSEFTRPPSFLANGDYREYKELPLYRIFQGEEPTRVAPEKPRREKKRRGCRRRRHLFVP